MYQNVESVKNIPLGRLIAEDANIGAGELPRKASQVNKSVYQHQLKVEPKASYTGKHRKTHSIQDRPGINKAYDY